MALGTCGVLPYESAATPMKGKHEDPVVQFSNVYTRLNWNFIMPYTFQSTQFMYKLGIFIKLFSLLSLF
jgi:hypothetical protein